MKKEIKITEFKSGKTSEKYDYVVFEKNMEIVLNSDIRIALSISPRDLHEFTYGFLFSSGLIDSPHDVKSLVIGEEKIEVSLMQKRNLENILSLGSAGGRYLDCSANKIKLPFKVKLPPPFEKLPALFREFAGQSIIFKETGGVHSAALCDGDSIKFFSEDIGRHNAVDKVIGKAFLAGCDFSTHFLLLSGRISVEMVKKSFYAGICTIVSRAAATSLAVEKAQKNNMSLIGFLRGDRFNIYL